MDNPIDEQWLPAPTMPGYEVSDMGNVRHAVTREPRKLVPSCGHHVPYLVVTGHLNGKHYKRYVHRLVALAFLEREPGYDQVHHIDADPHNNMCENLMWVTRDWNIREMHERRKEAV